MSFRTLDAIMMLLWCLALDRLMGNDNDPDYARILVVILV